MSGTASMAAVSLLPQSWAGGRRAGIRARLRRAQLDHALAQGADPWSAAELLVRASRLGSLSERRTLSAGLHTLVSLADRQRRSPYAGVRYQVLLEQRDSLLAVAERLAQPAPVDVSVVAQIALLLSDPSSPVYEGGKNPRGVGEVTERCLQRLQ